ncbi:hypothetical protein ACFY2M_43695 [Streptomyces sp. NPDC001276]|uniref:hypothetical protein n=1 Tax=Streptomyces sp. NPDC001276 TaxID=3364555 RepID=UPI0036CA16E6
MPLPEPVAEALKEHIERFPPVEVTLPWMRANGQPVTKRLIFSGSNGGHVWRTSLNEDHWKPALAKVGVIPHVIPQLDCDRAVVGGRRLSLLVVLGGPREVPGFAP